MLRRIFVGLAAFQLLTGNAALADTSDAANIRSLRASALQHCAQGQIEIGLRSFGDAIRLAEKSFGKDSTYVADLCFDAGVAAMKKDQYHDAETYLTKAVGLNPNAAEARLKLAEFYKMKGRLNDAKSQLAKVLAHDPVNVEARELLALTYQKEGNAARATEECWRLEQIASQKPNEFAIAQVAPLPAMPVSTTAAPVTTGNLGTFSRLAPKTPETPAPAPAKEEPKPATPPATPPAAKTPPPAKPAPQPREQNTRSSKHSKKERSRKESKRDRKHRHQIEMQQQPQEETSAFGTQARLRSKVKILNAAKNITHGSSDSEAAVVAAPPVQPAPRTRPARTRNGMVPPPPPVVPVFQPPMPIAPPPKAVAPQPKPAAPKLQQATPKEDPGEESHSSSRASESHSSAGSSSSSSDDDGDFLLDWAGKKKKKGK